MSALSERQRRMLAFIKSYAREHGYPPSIRDICQACAISSTSVADYNLRALERAGQIRRARDVSRGIEILDDYETARTRRVPILGTIAAGQPIPVPDTESWTPPVDETLELTQDLLPAGTDVFALRVKGTSMIDALINDGDIVLLRPQQVAENGEMVAIWLRRERETTLKKFYRERDRIRLQPANTTMAPIYVEPDDVEVQGKVVGVIRHV